MLVVTAWREALRRAGPLRPEVYASMLSDASLRIPEVSPFLEAIGLSEHDLALPYLDRLPTLLSIVLLRNCLEMIRTFNRSVKRKNSRSSRFGPNAATLRRFSESLNSIPTGFGMLVWHGEIQSQQE